MAYTNQFRTDPKSKPKECLYVLKKESYKRNRDGVYTPYLRNGVLRWVFCVMTTDGGGLTVSIFKGNVSNRPLLLPV